MIECNECKYVCEEAIYHEGLWVCPNCYDPHVYGLDVAERSSLPEGEDTI